MDSQTAEKLLIEIKKADDFKMPEYTGIAKYIPSFSQSTPVADAVQKNYNQELKAKTFNNILKVLGLSLGAGIATRGYLGLRDNLTEKPVKQFRTVDMPIPYPEENEKEKEKKADNDLATSSYGLDYYIPSMVLGAPLAFGAGWKGVDALLARKKKQETEAELEEAKKNYEKSLLGAYKKAIDSALTNAFNSLEKKAGQGITGLLSDIVSSAGKSINETFPNLAGATKGTALTYALGTLPAGYILTNEMMRKASKREVLRKAIEERARRQALYQPKELYAVPVPQKQENKEEEEVA